MSKNKLLSIAAAVLMAFSAVSCSSEKNVKPEPDIPEVNKTAEKVSENSFKKIMRYFEQSDLTDKDMKSAFPLAASSDKYYFHRQGGEYDATIPKNCEHYFADIKSGSVEFDESADIPEDAQILFRNDENIVYSQSDSESSVTYGYNIKNKKTVQFESLFPDRDFISDDKNGNIYAYDRFNGNGRVTKESITIYDSSLNKIKEIDLTESLKEFYESEPDAICMFVYGLCVSDDGKIYLAVSDKYQWVNVFEVKSDGNIKSLTDKITDFDDGMIVNSMFMDTEGNIVVCCGYGDVQVDVISPENGETVKRYDLYGVEDLIGAGSGYDIIYRQSGGIFGYSYIDDEITGIVTSEDISEMDESYGGAFITDNKLYISLEISASPKLIVLDKNGGYQEYESGDMYYADTDDSGNLVYITSRHYIDSDDEYGTFEAVESKIYKMDADGGTKLLFTFPQYHREIYPANLKVCRNGNILCTYPASEEDAVYSKSSIIIFDESGNIVNSIKLSDDYFCPEIVKNEQGELFVYNDGMIQKLNEETGEMSDVPVGRPINQVFDGNSGYDFYYSDIKGIYGYKVTENISEDIFYYSECDEELGCQKFIITSSSEIISTGGKKFEKVSDEKLDKLNSRNIITLAAVNSYEIQPYINEFNKTSEDCRIFLKAYETDTEQSHAWNDISSKLNQDIATGNIPDIILTNGIDVSSYVKSGLFTDHRKLVENDPETSSDVLNQPVCSAFTYKDSLYCIPVSYSSSVLISAEKKDKLTYGDFLNITENNEKVFRPYSYPWDYVLGSYFCDAVDLENGKCDFDNETFVSLLEFSKKGYGTEEEEDYSFEDDSCILDIASVNAIYDYDRIDEYYPSTPHICGFPSESGEGRQYIYPLLTLAVTEASENKSEAWTFIRSIADKQDEYTPCFFRLSSEENENYPEDTVKGYEKYKNMPVFTDMMYNRIRRIISEETEAFYADQKTAEETAKIIQNKVSLMLSETE